MNATSRHLPALILSAICFSSPYAVENLAGQDAAGSGDSAGDFAGVADISTLDGRAIDPSDIFYQGWKAVQSGQKLEDQGQHDQAWEKYSQAATYFDTIKQSHPDWKPHILEQRIKSTKEALAATKPKALEQLTLKKKQTEHLVEGIGGGETQKLFQKISQEPKGSYNSIEGARIKMLAAENAKLKKQLDENQSATSLDPAARARLAQSITHKDKEIKNLRDILARAPMQTDIDRIQQESIARAKEIDIVASALKESLQKLTLANNRANKKEAEAQRAQNQIAKLTRDMNQQQDLNNKVIASLREDMKELNVILTKANKELGASRAQSRQLTHQLEQAQTVITELTKERDSLRLERDSLHEILDQKGLEGTRKLIAENMRLGTELKQSRDLLQFLETNHDSTKALLAEAQNKFTLAKNRAIKYRDQYIKAEQRNIALTEELTTANQELTRAESQPGGTVNQEEVALLKGTINRLLTTQKRRTKSYEILRETYQNANTPIDGMDTAFENILTAEIELSDEEQQLIANRLPDQEFQNPQRVSMQRALASGKALKDELKYGMSTVVRMFEKGSYLAANQILQDLDERSPGNVQILCTRGVIALKTADFPAATELFNEAITMNDSSYYAHYMLGVTHYKQRDLDNARKAFEKSIDLRPTNEKAHLYLGCIAGEEKRFEQSEESFKIAVQIAPTYADAYHNLAALYYQKENKYQALHHYQEAIKHGKEPNFELERSIKALKQEQPEGTQE